MEKGIAMLDFLKDKQPTEYSSLILAYIGDAVYELYVRNYIVSKGNSHIDEIHRHSVNYVKASAQCKNFHKIKDMLTEEEMNAFKRGRNSKSRPPKNADAVEYRIATGFEALIGYIYIKGDEKRLDEIMSIILNSD